MALSLRPRSSRSASAAGGFWKGACTNAALPAEVGGTATPISQLQETTDAGSGQREQGLPSPSSPPRGALPHNLCRAEIHPWEFWLPVQPFIYEKKGRRSLPRVGKDQLERLRNWCGTHSNQDRGEPVGEEEEGVCTAEQSKSPR